MTLRTRLLLLFGTLVSLAVLAEWWLVRSVAADLDEEVGEVAYSVGSSLVSFFVSAEELPECVPPEGAKVARKAVARIAPGAGSEERALRMLVLRTDAGPLAADHAGLWVRARDECAEPGANEPRINGSVDLSLQLVDEVAQGPRMDSSGGPAAGAFHIPIPSRGFERRIEEFSRRLLAGTAAVFAVGLLAAAALAHRVSVPLQRLSRAASRVGSGELGTQIAEEGDREVASTIAAFNHMSARLCELDCEARELREREHLTEIGEVARGVAHALRNPLNALGLAVDELAAAEHTRAERAALARSVRGEVERIDRALRSFLALSSGAGGTSAARAEVDLADVARDVALEVLQDPRLAVDVEVDAPPRGAPLRGVAPELRAIVHALVVNAAEASPPGGRVRVAIAPRAPGDQGAPVDRGGRGVPGGWELAVEDDGPGLEAHVRERLFTPHLSTKEHGAGMGLFLARRVAAHRYAGSLVLEEREPRGTRAVLRLASGAEERP